MDCDARFSLCRQYRYILWRIWDESRPLVMFIGLNPSTADETKNDPTINRCINYSKSWGYGGLYMTNLFAFRATKPVDMKKAKDAIGPDNDKWLVKIAQKADIVIAAWGNHGRYLNRSETVVKMLSNLYYLKLNQSGEPAHPLYLKADLNPIKMNYESKINL